MIGPRSFDPRELGDARVDELDAAAEVAGWLEASVTDAPGTPSTGFGDRVMAALADEPTPSTVGFLVPVRRRGLLGGFTDSVRQAWASVGGNGRPVFARASALAYVLAVAIAGSALAGAATIGVAGALGIFGPTPTQTVAPPTLGPIVTPAPSEPAPEPTTGPVSPTPSPSDDPEASDDHGGGSGPEPSDDHGGNSGPGSSGSDDNSVPDDDGSESASPDSGSDSSGVGSEESLEPSDTPRPTGTPKPTETPR